MAETQCLESKKKAAQQWFNNLRDVLCLKLELCEIEAGRIDFLSNIAPGTFDRKCWVRESVEPEFLNVPSRLVSEDQGGGEMSIMQRGRIFEKAGVNVSTVSGVLSADFRHQIRGADKDPSFWASGISVVIHPRSPHVPAVHMNTRMIVTTTSWFGGGSDLTPVFPDHNETKLFHNAFEHACNKYSPTYYKDFKKQCDEYFYLPHRKEPRGVGGVFYDYLDSEDWEADFKFTQDIGKTFASVYPKIINNKIEQEWTEDEKYAQRIKRGRYVEFNLLYDKGTLFGLKTGGNTDAIFMSLPPEVSWP